MLLLLLLLTSFLLLAAAATGGAFISFLKSATTAVVSNMKNPINRKNPFKLTNPLEGSFGNLNKGRHKVSLDSISFNAKNPTNDKKYPIFCPIELQIGPLPRFFLDNIVKAHPSTAISCVAIKKYKAKKKAVTPLMFMVATLSFIVPIESAFPNPNCRSTKSDPPTMISPARVWIGINHDFRRPKRLKKHASTIGAHNNLSENGQLHSANIAMASYVARDASDATAADVTVAVATPAVAAAAAVIF
mmetsp:Transcript_44434/g.50168  ORF Transcript_44434/g.50168 Transcript_44434/m.50168 type:complete len:246 (-) Transcript_44434:389-1126(-)